MLMYLIRIISITLFLACFQNNWNYQETGMASYYAEALSGRNTANGEIYHPDSLTAAHRSLPFGTVILVEEIASGRKVKVRVNDRGPYMDNRIIDLSNAAARELGIIKKGVSKVRLKARINESK